MLLSLLLLFLWDIINFMSLSSKMALVDNGLKMTINCAFQRRAISAKKRKM